jgi:hypothetical protein
VDRRRFTGRPSGVGRHGVSSALVAATVIVIAKAARVIRHSVPSRDLDPGSRQPRFDFRERSLLGSQHQARVEPPDGMAFTAEPLLDEEEECPSPSSPPIPSRRSTSCAPRPVPQPKRAAHRRVSAPTPPTGAISAGDDRAQARGDRRVSPLADHPTPTAHDVGAGRRARHPPPTGRGAA